MDDADMMDKLKLLEEENETLKKELNEIREQLNKYLLKNKNYYEKNKEKHIENVKKYKEEHTYTPSKEQKKEWARRAYLKKKEKIQNEKNNGNI